MTTQQLPVPQQQKQQESDTRDWIDHASERSAFWQKEFLVRETRDKRQLFRTLRATYHVPHRSMLWFSPYQATLGEICVLSVLKRYGYLEED